MLLRIRTKMTPDQARIVLQDLVASGERATGFIDGDTFRIHPKSHRRSVPVTLRGWLTPEAGGTLICAWPFPHWLMLLWFPVWAWFCIQLVHAPWFVLVGFILGVVSFIIETQRSYDLLRQIYAA